MAICAGLRFSATTAKVNAYFLRQVPVMNIDNLRLMKVFMKILISM